MNPFENSKKIASSSKKSSALFEIGKIVGTPGAMEALKNEGEDGIAYLERHLSGDWGELDEEDKKANELALSQVTRLFSAYTLPRTSVKIWVITEADRSATTVLLPEEY